MSANFNKVILAGNLTRDPEIRYINDGTAVAKFAIAINRRTKSRQDAVDYVDIVVWDKLAEHCTKYLHKGSGVLVEGEIRTRTYEKDGEKRRVTEIVASRVTFLDKKPSAEGDAAEGEQLGADERDLDEIPF